VYFDEHQLRRTFIFYKVIDITFKYKKIVGWIIMIEEQLMKLNLGNEEPKDVFIGAILLATFQIQAMQLLMKYKYVFAWNYKELKFIPRKLYEHKIELMVDV
jgi:hypothetical protein